MTRPVTRRSWIRWVLPFAGLLSGCGTTAQHETLQHGPFEIVAEGRRISAGGFPNTSGNPFRTMEVTSFRVNYQGKPVIVHHGNRDIGQFWIVLRLMDAPHPSLIVATNDVHLITENNGQLVTRSFEPEPSTNTAMLQWLDGDKGQPSPVLDFGIARTPVTDTSLEGGRYLRSRYAVLDVKTLELKPFDAWLDRRPGESMAGLNASGQPAIAFSPQHTQFVALGSDDQREPGLLVIDFDARRCHGVPIDRAAMRMRDGEDVTPAWVAHHYEWERDTEGRDKLVPRADFAPWPWQGRVVPFGGHFVEYRIDPVGEPGLGAIRDWLVRTFGGAWVPDPSPSATTQPPVWQPPDSTVRLNVSWRDERVSVYETTSSGASRTAEGEAWVRRVAERFDGELRTGQWDRYFVPAR